MTPRIAIIDDDREQLGVLCRYLERKGFSILAFDDPTVAVAAFMKDPVEIVVCDVQMPGMNGIDVLNAVQRIMPGVVVIMITGFGSVRAAVAAMKQGAFDYISKPFEYDEFISVLQKAVDHHEFHVLDRDRRVSMEEQYRLGDLVGRSTAMQRVFGVISRIADTRTPVLIEGPSGSGKELVARAIHATGKRRSHAFVAVNCGALPESLLENELFGHVRGAYTGAFRNEQGLFLRADKGTLFLDEVADMPLSMQAKLLRVLEDLQVRPVGGSETREVDVRIVTATKEPIAELVKEGRFREDLYYRLNVVSITLPPLKERLEDLPLLVHRILDTLATQGGAPHLTVSPHVMDIFCAYDWPGNVRELAHVLERAALMTERSEIGVQDLPLHLGLSLERPGAGPESVADVSSLDAMEREHIARVLREVDGHRTRAAAILGINRRTLYRKIRDYGLEDSLHAPKEGR